MTFDNVVKAQIFIKDITQAKRGKRKNRFYHVRINLSLNNV